MLVGGLVLAGWLISAGIAASDDPPRKLSQVALQAQFLHHFVSQTIWPERALPEGDSIQVAVVGSKAVVDKYAALVRGREVGGHPVEVRGVPAKTDDDDDWSRRASQYHVIFVVDPKGVDVSALLRATKRKPVLVTAWDSGFARRGGHIALFTRANKPQLELNAEALKESGLRVTASIARNSERVKTEAP